MTTLHMSATKAFIATLAITVFAGAFFVMAPKAEAAQLIDGNRVVVERGDTLSGIALQYLGNANLYPQIAALNNIQNPNVINPGQVLQLPGSGTTTPSTQFDQLFQLLILDEFLADRDSGDLLGGDNSLVDLIILSQLFGNDTSFGTGTSSITGSNNLLQWVLLLDIFDRDNSSNNN